MGRFAGIFVPEGRAAFKINLCDDLRTRITLPAGRPPAWPSWNTFDRVHSQDRCDQYKRFPEAAKWTAIPRRPRYG
jgi:hypothetical protein